MELFGLLHDFRRLSMARSRGCLGIAALSVGLMVAGVATAAEQRVDAAARNALSLTVYNNDLALVSETRQLNLAAGETRLLLDDVSAALRPETLLLAGPDLKILEQSFTTDLITPRRLLETHVGRRVKVVSVHPQSGEERFEDAELLAVSEGAVVRRAGRIEVLPVDRIAFGQLPEGLRVRPALLATVAREQAGTGELQMRYLTGGLNWRADYVAELNESGQSMSLTALVTLENSSGSEFRDAELRLVAGDVNQVAPRPGLRKVMQVEMAASFGDAMPAPRSLAERYLYELPGRFDLAAGEIKQIPLFVAEDVAVRRIFRVTDRPGYNSENPGPVNADIVLALNNSQESGLGRPLPAGTLRVYQTIDATARIFSGEDTLAHAAAGTSLELRLGGAFDLSAEPRQVDFRRLDKSSGSFQTMRAIFLKNAKEEAVEIEVIAVLPRGWRMLEESQAHEKLDAQRARWRVAVSAGGESELRYRVQVTP